MTGIFLPIFFVLFWIFKLKRYIVLTIIKSAHTLFMRSFSFHIIQANDSLSKSVLLYWSNIQEFVLNIALGCPLGLELTFYDWNGWIKYFHNYHILILSLLEFYALKWKKVGSSSNVQSLNKPIFLKSYLVL